MLYMVQSITVFLTYCIYILTKFHQWRNTYYSVPKFSNPRFFLCMN